MPNSLIGPMAIGQNHFMNSAYFTFHGWKPARVSKTAQDQLKYIETLGFKAQVLGYPNLLRKSDGSRTGGSFIYYCLSIGSAYRVFSTYRDMNMFVEGFKFHQEIANVQAPGVI